MLNNEYLCLLQLFQKLFINRKINFDLLFDNMFRHCIADVFLNLIEILFFAPLNFQVDLDSSDRKFDALYLKDSAIIFLQILFDKLLNVFLYFGLVANMVLYFIFKFDKNLLFEVFQGNLVDSMLKFFHKLLDRRQNSNQMKGFEVLIIIVTFLFRDLVHSYFIKQIFLVPPRGFVPFNHPYLNVHLVQLAIFIAQFRLMRAVFQRKLNKIFMLEVIPKS